MGKLWCRCGYLMSNVSSSNNVNLNVFTETGFEAVMDGDFNEVLDKRITVWWCPICQRMYHHDIKRDILRVWALEKEAPSDAEVPEETWTERMETRYFDDVGEE